MPALLDLQWRYSEATGNYYADGWGNSYFIRIKSQNVELKSWPQCKQRVAVYIFPQRPEEEAVALAKMCAQAIEDTLHVMDEEEPMRRMRIMGKVE